MIASTIVTTGTIKLLSEDRLPVSQAEARTAGKLSRLPAFLHCAGEGDGAMLRNMPERWSVSHGETD